MFLLVTQVVFLIAFAVLAFGKNPRTVDTASLVAGIAAVVWAVILLAGSVF